MENTVEVLETLTYPKNAVQIKKKRLSALLTELRDGLRDGTDGLSAGTYKPDITLPNDLQSRGTHIIPHLVGASALFVHLSDERYVVSLPRQSVTRRELPRQSVARRVLVSVWWTNKQLLTVGRIAYSRSCVAEAWNLFRIAHKFLRDNR